MAASRTRGGNPDPSSRDFDGVWWLPDEPERRVPGTLRMRPSGPLVVEFMGVLGNGHPDDRHPVVLGATTEGQAITLAGAVHGGLRWNSSRTVGEQQFESLSAEMAFVGEHLVTMESRGFNVCEVELDTLPEWAAPSGLRDAVGGLHDYAVTYTRPERLVATVPHGTLSLGRGWGVVGDGTRSRTIESLAALVGESERRLSAQDWLHWLVRPMRHFLTFATDRASEVVEVRLSNDDMDTGTYVELLFPRPSPRASSSLDAFEFLFDLRGIESRFPDLLTRWYALLERIGVVIDMHLGRRYRPDTYLDNHFLNVVGALEAYHRNTTAWTMMSKREFKRTLKAASAAVDEQHRRWLRMRLAHADEPTLRERVMDLHRRVFQAVAGFTGSGEEFADAIVTARNGLTHRDETDAAGPSDGASLLRLTNQASLVLTACLLLDLGFSDTEAASMVRQTRAFRLVTEPSAGVGRGRTRDRRAPDFRSGGPTQRITGADLAHGRIRIPARSVSGAKAAFPAHRTRVDAIIRGKELSAHYNPRFGPDRERSGELSVGKAFLRENVSMGEVLMVSIAGRGKVRLD